MPSTRSLQWVINQPADYLAESAYAAWISVVATSWATAHEKRPRLVRVVRSKPASTQIQAGAQKMWVVVGHPEGPLAAPGAVRANRWLTGRRRAAQRVWERYGIDQLMALGGGLIPTGLVDVGANMGEFTLAFRHRTNGPVFAFEPDPLVRSCLEWNTRDTEVRIFPLALSNEAGLGTFYMATANGDSSLEQPGPTRTFQPFATPTISVQRERLDSVGLASLGSHAMLKMDAEGHEPEVLIGAGSVLADFAYIAIDSGPERQGRPTTDAVREILDEAGFSTTRWKNTIVHGVRLS